MTIMQEYAEYSGLTPEKADNDRLSGVQQIHEYLRFTPKPPKQLPPGGYNQDIAMRILRLEGNKKFEEYMAIFKEEEPEVNLPKLQIFEPSIHTGTQELIEALLAAQYATPGKDGKSIEDYAEFDGDDPYDGIRYIVDAAEQFVSDANNEMKKIQKQEAVVAEFQQTGDYNKLFNRFNPVIINQQSYGVVRRSVLRRRH